MGLLDGTIHKDYYEGNDLGNYQFISLDDIITQFEVAYVGENKIIPKIKRADVAFHAQRALQELSFDTFKSVKSQQIDLPPSLVMPLPHDYVNYTKISTVDSSGIKHPLYPTRHTSNPFQIQQESDGSYDFSYTTSETGILENGDFSATPLTDAWSVVATSSILNGNSVGGMAIESGILKTAFHTRNGGGAYLNANVYTAYQAVDVSNIDYLDISADGTADTKIMSSPASWTKTSNITGVTTTYTGVQNTTPNPGVLRVGITSQVPSSSTLDNRNHTGAGAQPHSTNINTSLFDLQTYNGGVSYVEWLGPSAVGTTSGNKELLQVDVSNQTTVYVVVVSFVNSVIPTTDGTGAVPTNYTSPTRGTNIPAFKMNSADNIVLTAHDEVVHNLIPKEGNEKNSSTWNAYKANTPSENNNDDYEDNTHWHMSDKRYGLDPQHAQINGSYYIDNRLGRINFSSNISGKTVILDYISDSLGTDAEMQVHKFAEDAMYKWIAHAILSTSSYGQGVARGFQRDKFAAVRKAKLRLSNIKIEELTQILRGKSKHIKH
jgi:hypothetical protein